MKIYNIKMENGEIKKLPYDDVCKILGIAPEIHFVKITTAGTISFTCGKPNEISYLKKLCIRNGLKQSKTLEKQRI